MDKNDKFWRSGGRGGGYFLRGFLIKASLVPSMYSRSAAKGDDLRGGGHFLIACSSQMVRLLTFGSAPTYQTCRDFRSVLRDWFYGSDHQKQPQARPTSNHKTRPALTRRPNHSAVRCIKAHRCIKSVQVATTQPQLGKYRSTLFLLITRAIKWPKKNGPINQKKFAQQSSKPMHKIKDTRHNNCN